MKRTSLSPWLFGVILCVAYPGLMCFGLTRPAAQDLDEVPVTDCMPRAKDYIFQRQPFALANPFLPDQPLDRQLFGVQTGYYGYAIDVANIGQSLFGPFMFSPPYSRATEKNADALLAMAEGTLTLEVMVNGQKYSCVGSGMTSFERKPENVANYPLRIIDSGPFVQRFDLLGLVFKNKKGEELDRTGRLEVTAWPDHLGLTLDLVNHANDSATSPTNVPGYESLTIYQKGKGSKFGGRLKGSFTTDDMSYTTGIDLAKGDVNLLADGVTVTAVALETGENRTCEYNRKLGQHRIELLANAGQADQNQGKLERYSVEIENPADHEQAVRLFFDKDMDRHWGVIGMTPMIRDMDGNPTGIPVQISKNWHLRDDVYPLYMGRWFHGYTMLHVPANSKTRFEFDITYGFWGGVPAASHAQLSLVGWGWNVLWQQVAIGDWSESICYQPVSPSCMIQDVRPLMTWGLDGQRKQWVWTTNVGGGDFLHYFYDEGRQRSDFTNPRVIYDEYGPNLTDVTYRYMIGDGNIAVSARTQTPRVDDLARHFHTMRYDVLKSTPFDSLCLYQLGSARYSVCLDNKAIAYGNADGLTGRVKLDDGVTSEPQYFDLSGHVPWVSLAGASSMSDPNGEAFPYAPNRGLIIRKWKARLGGKDVPVPMAALERIRREKNLDLFLRLTAPEDCHELLPGDFVEAEIELIVPPKQADDYYGPNENLRKTLADIGDSWRVVHREAVGNDLDVALTVGRLVRAYPLEIALDDAPRADFTVSGGIGYVPMVFTGLTDYRGYELFMLEDGKPVRIDQSVHGNDYWQTKYEAESGLWRLTYNVNLDTPGDRPVERRFIFRKTGTK